MKGLGFFNAKKREYRQHEEVTEALVGPLGSDRD